MTAPVPDFIRVFLPCACQPPRVFSVDVARHMLEAVAQGSPEMARPMLAFRCRRCGTNQVTWERLIRAAKPRKAA